MKHKGLPERRAARLIGLSRTVLRYKKQRQDDSKSRQEIRRIAHTKRAYGYRMVWRKLRQRGHEVNHKRVYRIYREEKLALRRKRRRKTPESLRLVIPTPEAIAPQLVSILPVVGKSCASIVVDTKMRIAAVAIPVTRQEFFMNDKPLLNTWKNQIKCLQTTKYH